MSPVILTISVSESSIQQEKTKGAEDKGYDSQKEPTLNCDRTEE
jgi:hypothetical protein